MPEEINHGELKRTVHLHAASTYHQLSNTTRLSKAHPCREVIDSITVLGRVMLVRVAICSICLGEKYSFLYLCCQAKNSDNWNSYFFRSC